MRSLLIGAALLAFAAPAAAHGQPVPPPGYYPPPPPGWDRGYDPRDEALVRSLPDQRQIDRMGVAIDRALGAVLDMPIGPLEDALDPYRRHDPRERLGDLGRRDDPYFDARAHYEMGRAVGQLGAASRRVAVAAPAIQRSLEDLERRIEDAVDGVPPPPPPPYRRYPGRP